VHADRVLIVGSQALHGSYPDPPIHVVVSSREIDVVPLPYELFDKWFYYAHERLGADSEFDIEHGLYVDMVRASTPKLPKGWEQRTHERVLRAADGRSVVAVYPEVHDLLASKLLAARPQDVEFLKGVRKLLSVDRKTIECRIREVALSKKHERLRTSALKSLGSAFRA